MLFLLLFLSVEQDPSGSLKMPGILYQMYVKGNAGILRALL